MKYIAYKRFFAAAGLLAIASGCSVSPAVDAVSLSVDGVSFLVTGKRMTDHAISAATGQDCVWFRMVKGHSPCVPHDDDVAGDRMVFELEASPWTESRTALAEEGDPLAVDAAIAVLVEPLGAAVRVETRSTAISAVAADRPLVSTAGRHARDAREPGVTDGAALVKAKAMTQAATLSRATRLWLPLETPE